MSRRLRSVPALVALVVVIDVVAQTLVARSGGPLGPAIFDGVNAAVLALAGGWVWRRRPDLPAGPLLVLTGAAVALNNLVYLPDAPALRLAGMVILPLFIPPLVYAVLSFPGRLERPDRLLAGAAVGLTTLSWWVVLLVYAPPPRPTVSTYLSPFADRELYAGLALANGIAAGLLGLTTAARAVRRWRQSTPAARRIHAPVMLSGAATTGIAGLSGPFGFRVLDGIAAPTAVGVLWAIAFLAMPLAVLGTVLRQRSGRLPLGQLLGAIDGGGEGLRAAIADALGDPTLDFAFRLSDEARWRDAAGRPLEAETNRALTPLGPPGARVAIVHDPALREDPVLLEAVARTAGLAIEHERLRAEVRAQLEDAAALRARIVRASDEARRRIERDLHDGAQQTLVSMALALGMLEEELREAPDDGLSLRLVRHAAEQAEAALAELRELARGVFPALLAADGLVPALEELAIASPLEVTLDLALPGRLAPEAEAAAWFLVREALANARVHGHARCAQVRAALEGDQLFVEVVDDGVGGARIITGGGLEQLADRVAALGGRLEVGEAGGGGTRLSARMRAGAHPAPPGANAPAAAPSA